MNEPEGTGVLDVAIVGAGFAGLYAVRSLREAGFTLQGFEAGDSVGGTWYWNRYPGARCDVESLQYCYAFDPELQRDWTWSERYATQPEILSYAEHVAERYDLRRHFRFNTRIEALAYDEDRGIWKLTPAAGDPVFARYVIMATGCLSAAELPAIPGLQDFAGRRLQTALWPKEGVDLSGLRVGVIGTGSSAIQAIPELAKVAAELHVFQRTANFTVPAHNRSLTPEEVERARGDYAERRRYAQENCPSGVIYEFSPYGAMQVSEAERQAEYERRWQIGGGNFGHSFNDLIRNEESNETAVAFFHDKIRSLVRDPEVADSLCPKGYPAFTRRLCVDTDYFVTFNRPNVSLHDLRRDPLDRITPAGVRLASGEVELDVLVFATGFDAMTGALTRVDIRGRDGQQLREKWSSGPRSYLGLAVAGFPNLFTVTGPGSPSVLSNMILSIEHHIDWITRCLTDLRAKGVSGIEAEEQAEDAWVDHVAELAAGTLLPKAASWYMGANIPGKTRVFMPCLGVPDYQRRCADVADQGYRGFTLSA